MPTAQLESFLRRINRELDTALTIPPGAPRRHFHLKFGQGGTPRPRYLTSSQNRDSLDHVPCPAASEADIRAFDQASETHKALFVETLAKVLANNQRSKAEKSELRAKKRCEDRQSAMSRAQDYLGLGKEASGFRAVFVCMDLEALEFSPHPVSEVGIAILDAADIRGVEPGPSGSGWWRLIKAHHLRVKEYAGMRNHQYVQGCPDAFDFG